jgi:geranylgeranyl transferase type-2 subunit beta
MLHHNRRAFLRLAACGSGALMLGCVSRNKTTPEHGAALEGIRSFIRQVALPDGSFRPGADPAYPGNSDTGLSGIAAPTYATILSTTFGWQLPHPDQTIRFFQSCQREDGAFYAPTGTMDMQSPLAVLYNTVQSVVALRLLGVEARYDPEPVISRFFSEETFKELPLYTTSFFSLFYCALDKPMPAYADRQMRDYILSEQTEDGYLQDHVAATFHAAHYFRMVGEPTPKAAEMVERVLRDQRDDGSWSLHEPDWDVHACFDALYILRQLGDPADTRVQQAMEKATQWILRCRKADGGFSHFPGDDPSDMDAVYFHAGGLVQTGFLPVRSGLQREEILGWGHAMLPEKVYSCTKQGQ